MLGYHTPWTRHPLDQTTPRPGTPLLGAGTPWEQTPPVQCMLGDTVNERVVCILLECNLLVMFWFWNPSGDAVSIVSELITSRKRGKVMFLLACVILSAREGVSVWGGLPDRTSLQDRDPPCVAKGERYVSYWNTFLFSKNFASGKQRVSPQHCVPLC